MGNAIWLFFALPQWFFQCLLSPLAGGWLTAIPAAGAVCLAGGVVWGALLRRRELLLFLALPALSHVLVVVAGFLRGQLVNNSAVLIVFLLIEIATAVALIIKMERARGPAVLLAVFSMTYALFAAFIAAMAFSDSWM